MGDKNRIELPKKEILIRGAGRKNVIELPKREILMGDIEGKKYSRTAKKGNFDG